MGSDIRTCQIAFYSAICITSVLKLMRHQIQGVNFCKHCI